MGFLDCICCIETNTTIEHERAEAVLIEQLAIQEKLEAAARKEEEQQLTLIMELALEEDLRREYEENRVANEERDRQLAWEVYSQQLPEDDDEQLAVAIRESLAIQQQLPQENASTSRSTTLPECEYCCETHVDAAFDPCGHGACMNCAVMIQDRESKQCPKCRAEISKLIKLFIS